MKDYEGFNVNWQNAFNNRKKLLHEMSLNISNYYQLQAIKKPVNKVFYVMGIINIS